MNTNDLTITLLVDQSPEAVFEAVKNVRGWWSETIEGDTRNIDDEFRYRHKDVHDSTQRLVELVPGKRIVWLVTASCLSFVEHKEEWTGTKLCFDIREKDGKTELQFTHEGLTAACDCFEACSGPGGWGRYAGKSLYSLIMEGKGDPDTKEDNTLPAAESN